MQIGTQDYPIVPLFVLICSINGNINLQNK